MPKSLVIGNGNLLATFDDKLRMRDFYYPFVGMEDHTTYGHYHRLGLLTENKFNWLGEGSWQYDLQYDHETLVGKSVATNNDLEISLLFEDYVYSTHDILFRKITIHNLANRGREIKIFFNHDFHLYGDKLQDTAIFDPDFNGILHYRKNRYFLISGMWEEDKSGLDEYSVGKSEYQGKEGTWRDAEDGHLQKNPVEQGSVDSTIGFYKKFQAKQQKTLYFWINCGLNSADIEKNQERIFKITPQSIYQHTKHYWNKWVNKQNFDFSIIPQELVQLFKKSLLIIRTQIDNRGAIIAANDSDIQKFNKDTYTYMWPRDGALVSMALCDSGYSNVVERFFEFIKKALTKDGYLLHKYNPDGSVGSSWHPKIKDNKRQLPIQEDESALILVALAHHYKRFQEIELTQNLFNDLVLKIGHFLIRHRDEKTGLPKPSYDLWEEQYGIFSYTAACTYAGLSAASFLSEITGHMEDSLIFAAEAEKMKNAILKYLYSKNADRFVKQVQIYDGEVVHEDLTVDASLAFIWKMKILPPDDFRVVSTMKAIKEKLWIKNDIGGIARYENDNYQIEFDRAKFPSIPGNPWIISTLWYADWLIALAKGQHSFKEPLNLLHWVLKTSNPAGILPEQVHALTGTPLSVAPLTWSHATFVATMMRYRGKLFELGVCQSCEVPQFV